MEFISFCCICAVAASLYSAFLCREINAQIWSQTHHPVVNYTPQKLSETDEKNRIQQQITANLLAKAEIQRGILANSEHVELEGQVIARYITVMAKYGISRDEAMKILITEIQMGKAVN